MIALLFNLLPIIPLVLALASQFRIDRLIIAFSVISSRSLDTNYNTHRSKSACTMLLLEGRLCGSRHKHEDYYASLAFYRSRAIKRTETDLDLGLVESCAKTK